MIVPSPAATFASHMSWASLGGPSDISFLVAPYIFSNWNIKIREAVAMKPKELSLFICHFPEPDINKILFMSNTWQ